MIKWGEGFGNSHGRLSLPLTELPTTASGLIQCGPFTEGVVSGSAEQSYEGGATCGVASGKKKAKKVSKGSLSGTLSIS